MFFGSNRTLDSWNVAFADGIAVRRIAINAKIAKITEAKTWSSHSQEPVEIPPISAADHMGT
jgi:hypothetical protein